jgi:hypothetical protein
MENDQKNEELLKELRALTMELCLANSLRRKFLTALVYGFGTVIGATLLIALLLYVLSLLASHGVFSGFNEWLIQTIGR